MEVDDQKMVDGPDEADREESIRKIHEAFLKVDTSRRGRVDARDIERYFEKHGKAVDRQDIEEALKFAGDGKTLTLNQFTFQLLSQVDAQAPKLTRLSSQSQQSQQQ